MANPVPHIDRKDFNDQELQQKLLRALEGKGEQWTVGDAVVASGLPKLETDRALKILAREYQGHLDVGESGEIVYRFPGGFVRRDAGSDLLARIGAATWKAFKLLFKIWILFTLVAYVAIFIALIIAAVVAMMAASQNRSSGSSSRGSSGGGAAIGLLNLIARIFFWHAVLTPSRGYGYGSGHRAARRSWTRQAPKTKAERAKLGKQARPLYKKVFAYVFGDEDRIDPLADDREILEHIRYLGGRVTAADLAIVTGWSMDRSDSEITRLMADYDGDARVTDEGALVYEFTGLLPSAQRGHGNKAPYWWERPDPVLKVSDNPSSTNVWITIANGFNLVMSVLSPYVIFPELQLDPAVWTIPLSTFPLVFSVVFFAVPLVRWIGVARANAQRKQRLTLRAWYRWVYEKHHKLREDAPAFQMSAHVEEAARYADKDVDLGEVGGAGIAAAEALDGERSDEVAGAFHFRRFVRELQAGYRARLEAPKDERSVGEVVFTSETPN